MATTYFASDGNYGDAHAIVILDTDSITEKQWDEILGLDDDGVYRLAKEIAGQTSDW